MQIQKWVPGGVHRRVCLELLTSYLLVWLLLSAESAMAELSSSVVYLPHLNRHQVHLQHNEFNIIMKNLHAWVNKQEHVLPLLLSGAISHKQVFKGHIHQLTMCKAPAAVAAF